MAEFKSKVSFDDVVAIKASDMAVLCDFGEGVQCWIPQSQIDDDSEVYGLGHKGTLVISEWIATQKNLIDRLLVGSRLVKDVSASRQNGSAKISPASTRLSAIFAELERSPVPQVPNPPAIAPGSDPEPSGLAAKLLARKTACESKNVVSTTDPPGTLAEKLLEKKHGPTWRAHLHPASNVWKGLFGDGPRDTPELRRILSIPVKSGQVPDLTDEFLIQARCTDGCELCRSRGKQTCSTGCARCADGRAHLWPLQNQALHEARQVGGLLGGLAVGGGKTLIALLLHDALGAERTALLVPPAMRDALKTQIELISLHWILPAISFDAQEPFQGIRVVAYSELSSMKGGTDLLERLDPTLVVADEAHSLRHKDAARTKRYLRLFKSKPEIVACDLSGTFMTDSVKDFGHLSEITLRKNSPLPGNWQELDDWSRVLDADVEFGRRLPPGALVKFCGHPEEDVKHAFRRRLLSTPGVVWAPEGELGVSLRLKIVKPIVSDVIATTLAKLEQLWMIGDEEMSEAMRVAEVSRQVAWGFRYVWEWPGGVKDYEWLETRSAWHKEVRDKLKRAGVGFDSPGLLQAAAISGVWNSITWPAWAAVMGRPEPPVRTEWLDTAFLRKIVLDWLDDSETESAKGVIWYDSVAVGKEIATRFDLPLFDAGTSAELEAAVKAKTPIVVCSIDVHGTGKNLQTAWSRALVLGSPANGTTWQQLLGRLHRNGQPADEVEYTLPLHASCLESAFESAMIDSRGVEALTGERHRLLYAQIERQDAA